MLQQINKPAIMNYRSQTELQRIHPEHKSYTCIYHAPRGMSEEIKLSQLRTVLTRKGIHAQIIYQIGDFFWIPETCICLERIGDNGDCPKHGKGLPQGWV